MVRHHMNESHVKTGTKYFQPIVKLIRGKISHTNFLLLLLLIGKLTPAFHISLSCESILFNSAE